MNVLKQNTRRQVNIDLAKCIAIVFMVLIHVMMYFEANLESGFGFFADDFLGGFMAAPVFMCAMGLGLAFSHRQQPEHIMCRGMDLLIIGYLLNFLRSLPLNIVYLLEQEPVEEIICLLVFGDILQFAGLALLLFGLLRKFGWNDPMILGVGIVCSIIAAMLPAQAKTFIVTVSDSLNLIYMIHWILLGILMIALSEVVTTIPAMAALAAVILALSVWLSICFKTFIRSHREQFQKPILRSL